MSCLDVVLVMIAQKYKALRSRVSLMSNLDFAWITNLWYMNVHYIYVSSVVIIILTGSLVSHSILVLAHDITVHGGVLHRFKPGRAVVRGRPRHRWLSRRWSILNFNDFDLGSIDSNLALFFGLTGALLARLGLNSAFIVLNINCLVLFFNNMLSGRLGRFFARISNYLVDINWLIDASDDSRPASTRNRVFTLSPLEYVIFSFILDSLDSMRH